MFDLSQWISTFSNQVAAFLSAIGTLIVFHKIMSPRVKFSEFVRSEDFLDSNRTRYSIKLAKTGPIDLVDIRISCRLYVKDIFLGGSKMWTTFLIPVTYSESAILGRDERIIYISLHKSAMAEPKKGVQIKKVIAERFETKKLSFELIFLAFPNAYLKLDLMGNDRFTGVLKVFTSNRYGLWAFRQGKWRADSIELIQSD